MFSDVVFEYKMCRRHIPVVPAAPLVQPSACTHRRRTRFLTIVARDAAEAAIAVSPVSSLDATLAGAGSAEDGRQSSDGLCAAIAVGVVNKNGCPAVLCVYRIDGR